MSDRVVEANPSGPGLAEDNSGRSEHKVLIAFFLVCMLTVTVGWWTVLVWTAVRLAERLFF